MKKLIIYSWVGIFLSLVACQKQEAIEVHKDEFHAALDVVTAVIVNDILSPPVASRVYNYANIAAYEIMAQGSSDYKSLAGQINGLTQIPSPLDDQIHYSMAAVIAYIDVAQSLLFTKEKIGAYQDSIYQQWSRQNNKVFEASKAYAMDVAEHMKSWISLDHYNETRTMPKFAVYTDQPARWRPTPPDYMDGIEPHWSMIRTLVIDSSEQFKPLPPPEYSMDKKAPFYIELIDVYDVGNQIKSEGDSSDQIAIAKFWDCNPYVSTHKGHLMFATKKITPGAHWIGICKIACNKSDYSFSETVAAHTKTSVAIADAFISCWDEKYRSNLIRPETLIQKHFDEEWTPVLQTPPFPEYTSGHSVVSGAAATILTGIFGDQFGYIDDTELPYGLPARSFTSFQQAAEEAAISRLYGGIHYRAAIVEGLKQGRQLGQFVDEQLVLLEK